MPPLENAFDKVAGPPAEVRKAFFNALRGGDVQAVRETLDAFPAAVTWQEPFSPAEKPYAADDTPLMTAAQTGQTDIVRLLLDHGAATTLDARNSRGYTALMYAAWHGAGEAAEMLLWHGADMTTRNAHGQDAFTLAHLRGHQDISRKIQAHRNKIDGPAAFAQGAAQDIPVLKPLEVRKRPQAGTLRG